MIYTVTFNPSLDYVVRVGEFILGNLHRTQAEELFVGGKGINVSTVLKELELPSVVLGYVAGFTGSEIINNLDASGISSDFIVLNQGISRINIKLKSDENTETEINGQGPAIDHTDLDLLYEKLNQLSEGDYLFLSGSVPKGLPDPDNIYANICKHLSTKKIKVIVDAEGQLLRNALPYKPFLVKPNRDELEMLFGQRINEEDDIQNCAKKLQEEGACNVLVSLAGEGALLIDEFGEVHRCKAPKGIVRNSVGAGDSMIAGFLAGMLCSMNNHPTSTEVRKEDYVMALKWGIAAGSAGAFSIGLPKAETIEQVRKEMGLG